MEKIVLLPYGEWAIFSTGAPRQRAQTMGKYICGKIVTCGKIRVHL